MKIKPTKLTTQIFCEVINEKPKVFAFISGDRIEGTVCFYKYQEGTLMLYEVNGLKRSQKCVGGIFGFHIHEGNSCLNNSSIAYEKTKGHYNPDKCDHPYHLGDLPPLFATQGVAWGLIYIDKFKPKELLGRTIVIHEHPDDFHSQPSGNSGNKIACGKIERFLKG